MRKIIHKPHLFFLALVPIVFLSGLLNRESTIDVNIHATYIVMDIWALSVFSTVFFFLIFINYYALHAIKKPAKRILSIIHIVLQIIALIPLFYIFFTADTKRDYAQTVDMNIIFVLGFVVFIMASFVHLINFFASLLGKKQ